MKLKRKPVFLDGASNTPLDPAVIKAMNKYLRHNPCGNSMSAHVFGARAAEAVREARETIAENCHVPAGSIQFTSGASEGNNWAILNSIQKFYENRKAISGCTVKPHIICSMLEHASVRDVCKNLETRHFADVTWVTPAQKAGYISWLDIKKAITSHTCLVCVMAVNNETGIVNPELSQITRKCSQRRIETLVDCTQWVSMGLKDFGRWSSLFYATYITFSAHKIYGPTGVGCLIARGEGNINSEEIRFPLIAGGFPRLSKRAGTENVAGIVGLAKAISLLDDKKISEHFLMLQNYLIDRLGTEFPRCTFNSKMLRHISNIISLNLSNYFGEKNLAAKLNLYDVAVSGGSACGEHENEPSIVLKTMGLSDEEARNTLRISFTKYTTKKDIDRFIEVLKQYMQVCVLFGTGDSMR